MVGNVYEKWGCYSELTNEKKRRKKCEKYAAKSDRKSEYYKQNGKVWLLLENKLVRIVRITKEKFIPKVCVCVVIFYKWLKWDSASSQIIWKKKLKKCSFLIILSTVSILCLFFFDFRCSSIQFFVPFPVFCLHLLLLRLATFILYIFFFPSLLLSFLSFQFIIFFFFES